MALSRVGATGYKGVDFQETVPFDVTLSASGSDKLVLALVAGSAGGTPSFGQPQLDSVNADGWGTIAQVDGGNGVTLAYAYWLDGNHPGTGTQSLTPNWTTGVTDHMWLIIEYTGADQSSPLSAFTTDSAVDVASGATGTLSADVTGETGEQGVAVLAIGENGTIEPPSLTDENSNLGTISQYRTTQSELANISWAFDDEISTSPQSFGFDYTNDDTGELDSWAFAAFAVRAAAGGGTTLVVQSATHGHTVDSPALTQASTLVVADAAHAHAADAPALTQASTLAVADAAHGHAADSIVLSQAVALVIADAQHAHTADNLALTAASVLAVNEALHGHAADNVTLSQGAVLTVAEASHGHQVDAVALTQASVLVVDDAQHAHAAESPELSTAVLLAVQEALHAHAADAPALTHAHTLVVQGATHAHSAETVTLIYGDPNAVWEVIGELRITSGTVRYRAESVTVRKRARSATTRTILH